MEVYLLIFRGWACLNSRNGADRVNVELILRGEVPYLSDNMNGVDQVQQPKIIRRDDINAARCKPVKQVYQYVHYEYRIWIKYIGSALQSSVKGITPVAPNLPYELVKTVQSRGPNAILGGFLSTRLRVVTSQRYRQWRCTWPRAISYVSTHLH